jgi:aminoglycoside/choline kinase family phosphotransferase
VHRDFRLDNLLFGEWEGNRGVAILDWQTACDGAAISDLSYFVGSALLPRVRGENERAVVNQYVSVLNGYGIVGLACATIDNSTNAVVVPWIDIFQCIHAMILNLDI